MDSETNAEVADILRITKEVIEQLGITSFRPVRVSWTDFLWTYTYPDSDKLLEVGPLVKREVPNGWVALTWDQLALPIEMKGKLDLEEWRPLITSSLIYEEKLRHKRYFAVVLILLPFILDVAGWWEFTVASTTIGIRVSLFLLDIFGLIAGFALLAILPKSFSKRLRLQADVLAEEITQREALLHVLEKIWTLGLQDLRLGNPFSPEFFNGRPSLEERIANLKNQALYRRA